MARATFGPSTPSSGAPDVGCESGDYNSNSIKAVRCDANLNNCTRPILISGDQKSIQFGDVTIGPDGRTYITWEQDNDLKTDFQPPEHMKFWIRVAPPGSTRFGPARLVAKEPLNMGIAPLHANNFRVATYPKNEVAMVGGKPRVFIAWDGCKARPASDSVCEEPRIEVARSADLGKTWGSPKVVSAGAATTSRPSPRNGRAKGWRSPTTPTGSTPSSTTARTWSSLS